RVEFSSDIYVLKPKAGGNGALILDVLNRGGKPVLTGFNRGGVNDPATDADLGDRFLLKNGFTLAWVGWEFDIPERPGLMRMYPPIAADGGKPISGIVRASFIGSGSNDVEITDLMNYDAVDPDAADSQLTVRSGSLGKPDPIARGKWRVNGHT